MSAWTPTATGMQVLEVRALPFTLRPVSTLGVEALRQFPAQKDPLMSPGEGMRFALHGRDVGLGSTRALMSPGDHHGANH